MLPNKTSCFRSLKALKCFTNIQKASSNMSLHQSDWRTSHFTTCTFWFNREQAWFWFLCYQTRHQNFDWKHGYFIDFLFSDVLSTVLSLLPCMNIIEKSFMFKIPQILVIMGAVTRQDTNIRFLPSNPWFMIENGWV